MGGDSWRLVKLNLRSGQNFRLIHLTFMLVNGILIINVFAYKQNIRTSRVVEFIFT